jgi:hypothetical protein
LPRDLFSKSFAGIKAVSWASGFSNISLRLNWLLKEKFKPSEFELMFSKILSSFHSFELSLTQDLSMKVDLHNLNEHSYLPDFAGATDSTLDLLVDRTHCSCCTTHLPRFWGSHSLNVRSLRTSRMVYASRAIGWFHKLLLLWHRACPSIF